MIDVGLLPGDKVVRQGAYSLAFAGGGSVSLKAALDAAHGHEHAADGSELKPGERAKTSQAGDAARGEEAPASPLWKIVSSVLFVLLVVSMLTKRGGSPLPARPPGKPAAKPAAEPEEAL